MRRISILNFKGVIYFVRFSRGAGAEPQPEREVSSQNPFFFHFVPPAAAQNEN